MHALIKELVIRQVEHRSETHFNEHQHLAEGTEVARLRRRSSFVLQQALLFRTRYHLCRQGVALASTRQLRFQGPVSVHAHRFEGVTESEGRKGVNEVWGGIGVGSGNGDQNRVGGGNVNGDGDEDGDGAGTTTTTTVEVNEGAEYGNGDGSRDRAGMGTGTGWRPVNEHRMGTGTGAGMETRAVVEMGTGTRMGTGTGTRMGSGKADEKQRSVRNRTIIVSAIRHF